MPAACTNVTVETTFIFQVGYLLLKQPCIFFTYPQGDKESLKKLTITVLLFYCPHFLERSQKRNQTAQKPSEQSSYPEVGICLQSIGGWGQWGHKAHRAFWIFGVFLSSRALAPLSPSFSLAAATFLWNAFGSHSSDVIYRTRNLIKEKHWGRMYFLNSGADSYTMN